VAHPRPGRRDQERMLVHGRPRGQIGRISASVNPLVPKPGTALPVAADGGAGGDRSGDCAAAVADARIDNVYFSIKSERHSFYTGAADRSATGAWRPVGPVAAERNGGQMAGGCGRGGRRPSFYVYGTDRRRTLPCGDHRRRTEVGLLPVEFEEGLRENGRCAEARRREHPPVADGCPDARRPPMPDPPSRAARQPRAPGSVRRDELLLVLGVGVQDELADRSWAAASTTGREKGKAPPLAVHRVLAAPGT